MKRFLLLASLVAAAAAFPLAGGAFAQLEHSGSFDTEFEIEGTLGAPGPDGTVSVTGEGGTQLNCSVPSGLDLTPFLTGEVELECELVDGVLTLRKIESKTTGVEVEVEDDGTITVEVDDEDEDNSGPGANSGPGNQNDQADDDEDEDEDHSGHSANSGSGNQSDDDSGDGDDD